MAIPIELQGSMRGNGVSKAEVYNPTADGRYGSAGLLVYTRDQLVKPFTPAPLLNSNFGTAMNQNGAFGGTPDGVHDGIDSTLWTGSNIVGTKVTFNSTDRFFAGAASVKIDNPNNGDIWEFDKGSNLTVASYTAVTLKLNIDKDWSIGDSVSIYGYDTGGSQVGIKMFLEDYIDQTSFDIWQSVTIPLADFQMTGTIDAFRMQQEGKVGKAAKFYIDNFQVEETGEPIIFTYEAKGDQLVHMTKIVTFAAVNGVSEAALQAYDKFYSTTALNNGVQFTVQSDGEGVVSYAERDLITQIIQPQTSIQTGGDGTNSWIKVSNEIEFNLDGKKRDYIEYRIQDDLTGLAAYSAWGFGWIEEI
jgi:hypothetical protein